MVFLDLIQSYIIKGVIILIILQAMFLLQGLLNEHTEKANLEGELSTATFTFSSEMRQAGYDTSATPITIAETSKVEIWGDIDNYGPAEKVKYYLSPMPSSTKFYLERTVNGGTPLQVGRNLRKFYLVYYDKFGNVTSDTSKISSLFVQAIIENDVQFHGDYLRSYWDAHIFPKTYGDDLPEISVTAVYP